MCAGKAGGTFMRMLLAVILALTIAPAVAGPNTREVPEGAKSPPAKVDVIAWMAGRWTGEGFGGQIEELFSPPAGGAMIGHYRNWVGDKVEFYELEGILEEKGSLVYRVKHFNPDLTGWEEKDKSVDFPLVAIEGNRIYFDGLTVEKVSDNEMRHYVLLKGKDGKAKVMTFVYRRAK